MNSPKMDAITQHSSQSEEDNLSFIKEKGPNNLRKMSSIYDADTKNNFLFKHQAITFTVTRAYIPAINDPQVRLYYSKFEPKVKVGAVCIIHGYGESSDDYIETAEYFAKRGFTANMIDLRGFGYSGGSRVNCPIKGLLSDIANLLTRCCENGLSTYVVSHGFGCLLTFALLQQNPHLPLSGVIALSPLFSFPNVSKHSFLQKLIIWVLEPIVGDNVLINNKINPTALTNNPQQIQKIIAGVFNFQYVTVKMFTQYNELSQKVLRDVGKFNYPLLVCVGNSDLIQSSAVSEKFIESVSSKERELIIFENGYHRLFNDINAEALFENILRWINNKERDPSKNQTKWNSAKVKTFKTNFLHKKNYIKRFVLIIVGILFALIKISKVFRK